MKNITTKSVKTAMFNVASRIRTDLVMHVAFIKEPTGGAYHIWVTPAGVHGKIEWALEFIEGHMTSVCLPKALTEELELDAAHLCTSCGNPVDQKDEILCSACAQHLVWRKP